MRLVGYAVKHHRFAPRGVYVPLGDLTVLVGANDAGKSTILRSIGDELARGASQEPDPGRTSGSAFYFEASQAELALLSRVRDRDSFQGTFLGGWAHCGYDPQMATPIEAGEATLDAHQRMLRQAATSAEFDVVLERLSESGLVCIERGGSIAPDRHGWRVHWCLPPLAELNSSVADALRRSDLEPFASQRARENGEESPVPQAGLFTSRPPAWLHLEGAPVIVAPLGEVRDGMPRAISVPASTDQLRRTIVESIRALVDVRVHGPNDAWRDYEIDEAELRERERIHALLKRGDNGSVRPHPVAVGALRLLTVTATAQLPEFVSRRYRLDVRFTDVGRWFEGDVIAMRLRAIDDPRAAEFDVDEVADGLKLWLQLAVLAGIDMIDRLRIELVGFAQDEADRYRLMQGEEDDELARSLFEDTVEALESLGPDAPPELPGALGPDGVQPARHLAIPTRILVADEPERHLSPRMQRRAARWLGDLADGRGLPCVAASHSAAFLSLPRGPQMIHVRRERDVTMLTPFDPASVDQLDGVAADLGFDRGELLAGVDGFLLVEGEHEIAVLEGIFGEELAEAKLSLVALRGSPPKGLLEVDALWRFTTAAVAVCLDNVRPDLVRSAQAGDQDALGQLTHASASNEEKALAVLIGQARKFHREIVLLGHPGTDLIDALDPAVVRAVYPRFPATHAEADVAYQQAVAKAEAAKRRRPGRKAVYAREFGIPNSRASYARIAAKHRELEVRPPALEAVVEAAADAASSASLDLLR